MLQSVYENKLVIDTKIKTENENEMLRHKKQVKVLKIKNTALTIGLGGLAATTLYFAVF